MNLRVIDVIWPNWTYNPGWKHGRLQATGEVESRFLPVQTATIPL